MVVYLIQAWCDLPWEWLYENLCHVLTLPMMKHLRCLAIRWHFCVFIVPVLTKTSRIYSRVTELAVFYTIIFVITELAVFCDTDN